MAREWQYEDVDNPCFQDRSSLLAFASVLFHQQTFYGLLRVSAMFWGRAQLPGVLLPATLHLVCDALSHLDFPSTPGPYLKMWVTLSSDSKQGHRAYLSLAI